MLVFEIAAGIVFAVVVLRYWEQILAVSVLGGLILVVIFAVIISSIVLNRPNVILKLALFTASLVVFFGGPYSMIKCAETKSPQFRKFMTGTYAGPYESSITLQMALIVVGRIAVVTLAFTVSAVLAYALYSFTK